ncbi:MAG: hypothetical protein HOP11_06785 [Saprospiraceae bacterium]|nr:hypothetical protein [Saprospiraceae bacterium]
MLFTICIFLSNCNNESELKISKKSSHPLSKKQEYYLQDNNRIKSRVGGSSGPTRVALEITVTSSDPSRNKKWIDCRQPGFSCSVSVNSLTGD